MPASIAACVQEAVRNDAQVAAQRLRTRPSPGAYRVDAIGSRGRGMCASRCAP
jgi:hypothetical protein